MALASVYRPGSAVGMRFTDTVELLSSASGTGFFLSIAELLPSLQSGTNRNFVFSAFRVELLPANDVNSPARIAQVRFRSNAMNEFVAMNPYKVLSRVNPSMVNYSVDRLARYCPTAKTVHSTTDTTLIFNLGFANENREAVVVRVTTVIKLFPQTNTNTFNLVGNSTIGNVNQRGELIPREEEEIEESGIVPASQGLKSPHDDVEMGTIYL